MDFHYPEIPKKDFIHEDKCCTSGLGIPTGSEACCRTNRGGPCRHFIPQTFSGLINSLAASGHRKFGWKRPHWGKLFIVLSFNEIKQLNLAGSCRIRTRINPVNFVRIVQGTRPLGAIILVKFWPPEPIKVKLAGRSGSACEISPLFHLYRCTKNRKICPGVKTIPTCIGACARLAGKNKKAV